MAAGKVVDLQTSQFFFFFFIYLDILLSLKCQKKMDALHFCAHCNSYKLFGKISISSQISVIFHQAGEGDGVRVRVVDGGAEVNV